MQSKSSYFQHLYEDRTTGLLPEKEFIILMNRYKDDNNKLEERMKIVKKEIANTTAKKETLKTRKNIFKKYKYYSYLPTMILEF